MNSTRKISGLWLLFLFSLVFIPLIFAEPLPGKEAAPGDGGVPALLEFLPEEEVPSASASAVATAGAAAADPLLYDDDFFDDDAFFFEAAGLVFEVSPIIEPRSFYDVFPTLSRNQLIRVKTESGLKYAFEKDGHSLIFPGPDSGIDLLSKVMKKDPSHIVETLVLMPYKKRELDLLDIYNALGRIKNIKDHKMTVNNKEYNIFTDTTRIVSAKERKPIADPPPTEVLPFSETMYLRFIDPSLGDLYLRADISVSLYGLTYNMTNFRDVSYYIFRVMKSDKFSAIIYLEPVKEGILIYSVSGLYLPNFIAKKVNITPNMNRRITVLINWITEGLAIQEERRQDKHFYRLRPKSN
jgi:hypothetical protein